MIKYDCTITNIGPYVSEFLDAGIVVLFGADAPEELIEFSIIHDGKELKDDLKPGDKVWIDQNSFDILAVGEIANKNFSNLGHLILKFNGENEPEMPGDVCLEKVELPEIIIGSKIKIEG